MEIEPHTFFSIVNHPPQFQVLKFTMSWEEISNVIQILGVLSNGQQVTSQIETNSTKFNISLSMIITNPIPATLDSVPSAIQTMRFSELGL